MSVSLLAVIAVALSVLFARNRQPEPAPNLAKDGVAGAAVSLEELRRAGF